MCAPEGPSPTLIAEAYAQFHVEVKRPRPPFIVAGTGTWARYVRPGKIRVIPVGRAILTSEMGIYVRMSSVLPMKPCIQA